MTDSINVMTSASLWSDTLGPQEHDENELPRERLRASLLSFRTRSGYIAEEIRRDLPDLTVHDLTHLDALWEIASMLVGSAYPVTPTEGYVLGGAILLHDLAMSVAATPGGHSSITSDPRWRDLLYTGYQEREGRTPDREEIENPNEEIKTYALFHMLRAIHAENAPMLAFMEFQSETEGPQFLIEDTELRQTFGQLIGEVAHSHWWSIEQLESQFTRVMGAPHWAPQDWTTDPLKVACILRTADAAQIDARRAPSFMRVFSTLSQSSDEHWGFQGKLNKPYVSDDALVFTSGKPFPMEEANAWWLCREALRVVDQELSGVDSLLSDKGISRFSAVRVAGVDSPERLANYIQTSGWLPINATVHISDLPQIIRSLGGEELYGRAPTVPLRELLQNACDAVRARRFYERRKADFGEISVELKNSGDEYALTVQDNGVGMSKRVLTSFLLDFGNSFWYRPEVQQEFPGLLSSGFHATGKYGIGFFSIFMAANRVTVRTRRPDAAAADTLVLSFGNGLQGRPILRQAESAERLVDGGTAVSLALKVNPYSEGGLLWSSSEEEALSLAEMCRRIAPAVDVEIHAQEDSATQEVVMGADDWRTISGRQLLARLSPSGRREEISADDLEYFRNRAAENVRPIFDACGHVVGRGCVSVGSAGLRRPGSEPDLSGVLVVGGLVASRLAGICGVLLAESKRAARDQAIPVVNQDTLGVWATKQAELVPNLYSSKSAQCACAQNIRLCGGSTEDLPIARHCNDWKNIREIEQMELPSQIKIIDFLTEEFELKFANDMVWDEGVFVTNASGIPVIVQTHGEVFGGMHGGVPEGEGGRDEMEGALSGAIVEAAAKSWGVAVEDVRKSNSLVREREVRVGIAEMGEVRVRAVVIDRSQGN